MTSIRNKVVMVGLALLLWSGTRAARPAAQQVPPAPDGSSASSSSVASLKTPPDFARDVLPLIENQCLRCHSAAAQKGGLVMDTQQDLLQGGEHGAVLTPGDSKSSRLVQMLEGTRTPTMPDKGKPLRPEDIAIFKAWIDAGAKDSPTPPLTLDERLTPVPAQRALPVAVNALAFSPDGLELAVPGYREVRRVGNATHGALTGAVDLVRGITYSRNGKWIAGAGGIPGVLGEVLLWNAETGELLHKLTGHRDYVYDADINHRSTRLATCSYDKTVRIWDLENGRPTHVFREHSGPVFTVAFSPDDKWVASGSGDRTVKLWDLASGARLYTLSEPTDAVQTVAFAPAGGLLSAAGNDRTIRTWALTPQGGTLLRATVAHAGPILRIAYSPDGRLLASSGADRRIKIWDAAAGTEVRTIEAQSDWSHALAWSPDGARLAVGRQDGTVSIYEVATGTRLMDPRAGLEAPRGGELAVKRDRRW